MSKIAEQKALEAYPEHRVTRYGPLYAYDGTDTPSEYDENIVTRKAFIEGYDQALCDIKQRIKEIIGHQEKEWGKSNVDIGLYTILGHIVEKEEEL